MMHYLRDKHVVLFILILIGAMAVRIFLLTHTVRHYGDALIFQQWFDLLRQVSAVDYYRVVDTSNFAPYPPLSIYLFKILSVFPLSADVLITLIASVADVCIGSMIFFYFFRLQKKILALVASAAFLLNPAVITITAAWGQIDSLYMAPLLCAFLAIGMRKPLIAAMFATLAIFFKVQGLIFLPLICVCIAVTDRKKVIPAIVAMGSTAFFIISPFIFSGNFLRVVDVYVNQTVGKYQFVSMNAWNIWWPVFHVVVSDRERIFGIQYIHIGLVLFAVAYAAILLLLIKKRIDPIGAAVLLSFSFFMLPTEIHERYLFPAFVFFPLLFLREHTYRILYCLLSIVFFCNLWFVLLVQNHPLNIMNPFELFIIPFIVIGWAINGGIFVKVFQLLLRKKLVAS